MIPAIQHFPADVKNRVWTARFLALLAVVAVVRVVYAACVPLDLAPDEAYYWDWGRRPAWGYFSKPPMIAWINYATRQLWGTSEFAVRLPAALLGSLGLIPVFLLARRIYDARSGFWAALGAALMPGVTVLSLLMTIDAPLMFCWCAAIYALWRCLDSSQVSVGWLSILIFSTGLGLLSKQTMLGIFPLAAAFLLLSPADRPKLRSGWFWTWIAGSCLFLIPVIIWNSQHGWVTILHTGHHFQSEAVSLTKHLAWLGEFAAGQFGVVSPILCGVVLSLLVLVPFHWKRMDRRERFLWCFSGLPLAGVFGLSFLQRVQPNWPAPFYVTGLVLAAGWSCGKISLGLNPQRFNWYRAGLGLGAVCCVIILAFPFFSRRLGVEGTAFDPTVRLRGWRELGEKVEETLQKSCEKNRTFLLSATSRTAISPLAFYLPDHPRVYHWNPAGAIESQHDLWPGPREKRGWNALVILPENRSVPSNLRAAFDDITPLKEIAIPLGKSRFRRYTLHLAKNYHP